MNDQRKVIFEQRIEIMRGHDIAETIADMRHHVIDDAVAKFIPANAYAEQWDMDGLRQRLRQVIAMDIPVDEWAKEEGIADEEIRERLINGADEIYNSKRERFGSEIMLQIEKSILLQTMDHLWREHIIMVDHLRQVIGLRGYGQRDPLNEYKSEGYNLFEAMITRLRELTTNQLMRVEISDAPPPELPSETPLPPMQGHHIDPQTGRDDATNEMPQYVGVSRNEPCPCGSGKRFKHCHGALS